MKLNILFTKTNSSNTCYHIVFAILTIRENFLRLLFDQDAKNEI